MNILFKVLKIISQLAAIIGLYFLASCFFAKVEKMEKEGKVTHYWQYILLLLCCFFTLFWGGQIGGDKYERIEMEEALSEKYKEGYNEGESIGYEEGHEKGYDYGFEEGYSVGCNEGYVTGYDEGYECGYESGYSDADAK